MTKSSSMAVGGEPCCSGAEQPTPCRTTAAAARLQPHRKPQAACMPRCLALPPCSEVLRRDVGPPPPAAAGYHRGVARDVTNATDVDHDVEVVGWGEQDGLK